MTVKFTYLDKTVWPEGCLVGTEATAAAGVRRDPTARS